MGRAPYVGTRCSVESVAAKRSVTRVTATIRQTEGHAPLPARTQCGGRARAAVRCYSDATAPGKTAPTRPRARGSQLSPRRLRIPSRIPKSGALA